MEQNVEKIISETIQKMKLISSDDIPNINLYMDQVTTFMESQLGQMKRTEDDKILTKTMINNYAKNDLLPSPEKKKYTKEHVIMLAFIYYFKNLLSINDINSLLHPLSEKYFNSADGLNLTQVYDEIIGKRELLSAELYADLEKKYVASSETFTDVVDAAERDSLQLFSLICMLSFDVYTKKQIIENLIDRLYAPQVPAEKEKKEKKEKEKKK